MITEIMAGGADKGRPFFIAQTRNPEAKAPGFCDIRGTYLPVCLLLHNVREKHTRLHRVNGKAGFETQALAFIKQRATSS